MTKCTDRAVVAFRFLSSVRKIFKAKRFELPLVCIKGRFPRDRRKLLRRRRERKESRSGIQDRLQTAKRYVHFFLAGRRERSHNKEKLRREKKDIHNC